MGVGIGCLGIKVHLQLQSELEKILSPKEEEVCEEEEGAQPQMFLLCDLSVSPSQTQKSPF